MSSQSLRNFCTVKSHDNKSAVMLWHYHLGHLSFTYFKKSFPSLFNNKSPKSFKCKIFQLSKHVHSTYKTQPYKASHPFSILHSDIWGPSRINNISGARWFVSFVDDHTRVTWIFLMKEKSELAFHSMIQTQFMAKIQVLKTDNAREYFQ